MQRTKAMPSGVTVSGRWMMKTKTAIKTQSEASDLISVAFVALLGAITVFTVGLAHSATLHDAAHDMRHATGFPCH